MTPLVSLFRVLMAALGASLLRSWKFAAVVGALLVVNSLLLIFIARRWRKRPSCCR